MGINCFWICLVCLSFLTHKGLCYCVEQSTKSCGKAVPKCCRTFLLQPMKGSSWLWPISCLAACLAPSWGKYFPLNSTDGREGIKHFFPFIHCKLAEGRTLLTQPSTLQPKMELSAWCHYFAWVNRKLDWVCSLKNMVAYLEILLNPI